MSAPALELFHAPVRAWFEGAFPSGPTRAQALGWPAISKRENTLLLAPTGSGKTLAAFLHCLDRLMFEPRPKPKERCRVLYVSPLKALAVDVERNLRAPLAGIAHEASRAGLEFVLPEVLVRTGDTSQRDRARFKREPADILITTPESLFLVLTSQSREVLRSVDTVIIDEIHALVPTKRGAHLALSLERLEALTGRPLQRIGLSATQRPLDEVARYLGGAATSPPRPLPERGGGAARSKSASTPPRSGRGTGGEVAPEAAIHDEFAEAGSKPRYRPVQVVDASESKRLSLRIEVPVEDLARPGAVAEGADFQSGNANNAGPAKPSIWTAIHPRLLELVRTHTSTLIFVNSRRIAERLAGALNELAGETLVRAHHGSLARPQRVEVEDSLKAGTLRGLVATSSLELGIDMGAVDLVVQIEAPPSVASGLQRIGRAGHQVGGQSAGIVFPKYRGDLVACAALARAMREGKVEASRYPRNPLDVLAQQLVAICAGDTWEVDRLFGLVRGAAPFAGLSRTAFENVLDLLAGRYASDEFAELRPRLTWDRVAGTVAAREGAARVAIANAGTIPDRGLYGVFLAGAEGPKGRVGELDEEMVFESHVGDTFVLGASTWRVEDITHDRVLVSPAPGEPGKMPFWRGDQAGRPAELGREIGRMVRELRELGRPAAMERLVQLHDLDQQAADNLLRYLEDQAQATGAVPDDRTIVIERCRDELGDWRVCVLSPFGGRVHGPWAMAMEARLRAQAGLEAEVLWTDDGIALRLPEAAPPLEADQLLPSPEEVEQLVMDQLGGTALFAARFREAAARALLLPRRRAGQRTPLWQQRKRASDLLKVASKHGSFPMLLEAYRECLRDGFEMAALVELLKQAQARQVRVLTVDSETPSPFAASLLFGFVANYLYEGDAPLAERRAQALAIDQAQLRELLGEAELRDLLDPDALELTEAELQHLAPGRQARHGDALHDLLLRLGDLSAPELEKRAEPAALSAVPALEKARRVVWVGVAGVRRLIAVEDIARYRDALGAMPPPGLPDALLEKVADPKLDLASRFARTHGPFTSDELATRYGFSRAEADALLQRLLDQGRVVEGAFRPGGTHREWCDPDVLRTIRRRSLAKLRKEAEPVEPRVLGRFLAGWHGLLRRRRGLDAVLDAVERLQGLPLPASLLETEILPARIEGYLAGDLDELLAAGEVVWLGAEPLGERDGRVALYLTDQLPRLARPDGLGPPPELDATEQRVLEHLKQHGASFFADLHGALGGGFPNEVVDALWGLVWKGLVTNDTLRPLRSYVRPPASRDRRERMPLAGRSFRSRRTAPPEAEGRWSLVEERVRTRPNLTAWGASVANQLLARYGIVTREVAQAESVAGGFSAVYEVLRQMEEAGRIRRGFFVAGVGAAQFALPAALDLLRGLRPDEAEAQALLLSAVDPANPYGSLLPWPAREGKTLARAVGAHVVLVDGALAAYVGRGSRSLWLWPPENEPDRSRVVYAVAQKLAELAARAGKPALLIEELNGQPAQESPLAGLLAAVGFSPSMAGLQLRRGAELLGGPRELGH